MLLTKCNYNIEAMKKEVDNGLKHLEVVGFNGIPSKEELDKLGKYVKDNGIDIRSVHMPTTTLDLRNKVRPNIEYLENDIFRENCKAICRYFNSLYENKRIKVILHTKTRAKEYRVLKSTYKMIMNAVKELLEYENIEVCLENVPIAHYESMSDILVGCFGCGLSFIDVAEMLREDIGTDRVKVLVDTCHTESQNAILRALQREMEVIELGDVLRIAHEKGVLGQIHLASQTGLGIVPGEHGLSLDLNEGLSDKIIDDIKPYIDYVDTTIEVEEDNYPDCKNAMKSYSYLLDRIK